MERPARAGESTGERKNSYQTQTTDQGAGMGAGPGPAGGGVGAARAGPPRRSDVLLLELFRYYQDTWIEASTLVGLSGGSERIGSVSDVSVEL